MTILSFDTCPLCGGGYTLTLAGRFRQHRVSRTIGPDGEDTTPRTATGAVQICGASGCSPEEARGIAKSIKKSMRK